MDFYTIMTDAGKKKIIDANTGGTKLDLEKIILGDGNGYYYNPSPTQTSLKHEVWRGNITNISKSVNPSWIKLETTIPSQTGGFYIREIGILDSDNTLIAVGKYPETYKPVLSDGSIKELYINVIIEVSDVSAINITLDNNITAASKKDLEDLDIKLNKDLLNLKKQVGDISSKELTNLENKIDDKIKNNTEKITQANGTIQSNSNKIREANTDINNIKSKLDKDLETVKKDVDTVKDATYSINSIAVNNKTNIDRVIDTNTKSIAYFVNQNVGSDNNNGLSNIAPFKTLEKAFDSVPYFAINKYYIYLTSDYKLNKDIVCKYKNVELNGGSNRIYSNVYSSDNDKLNLRFEHSYPIIRCCTIENINLKIKYCTNSDVIQCKFKNNYTTPVDVDNSNCTISISDFTNCKNGVISQNTSFTFLYFSNGSCSEYGYICTDGATVRNLGSKITGDISNAKTERGGLSQ